jgi:tetratricopeptide (TPR) repeat protein
VKANKSAILYLLIIVLVFALPMRPVARAAGFVAVLLYPTALSRLKRWIYRLARSGAYDQALRFDSILRFMPFYGNSLKGSILFNAGRYAEARTFLKPLAFDQRGEPRLTNTALYLYALALTNDDRAEEALPLLEAAARMPKARLTMRVALVGCLLTLGKDPFRACALMEDVLAREPVPTYEKNADQARRLARYAWALGACGRRDEAETQLIEASAGSFSLAKSDQAGIKYFAGQAWRMLGEKEKSRTAFNEAIVLSPNGSTAMSARKGLAKLETAS